MSERRVLIYGAAGYAGRMICALAVSQGRGVIAAGRDAGRLADALGSLDVEQRVLSLDAATPLSAGLADVAVVVNCAGPFSRTQRPLIEACLRAGVHYTDLAGEVPEFVSALEYDAAARQAEITVMPGTGFGVVPTDALAVHVAARLDEAVRLELAYRTVGGVSRGTAGTVLSGAHRPGWRVLDGSLTARRPAAESIRFTVGEWSGTAVTNPWRGDLVTAPISTGIPTVDTYAVFPAPVTAIMHAGRMLGRALDSGAWQGMVAAAVRRLPEGPDEAALAKGRCLVWARATAADGRQETSTLLGPDAYVWTAAAALAIAERLMVHQPAPGSPLAGFATPAGAFGADVVLDVPSVTRTDQSHALI